jgi:hypothetical protein
MFFTDLKVDGVPPGGALTHHNHQPVRPRSTFLVILTTVAQWMSIVMAVVVGNALDRFWVTDTGIHLPYPHAFMIHTIKPDHLMAIFMTVVLAGITVLIVAFLLHSMWSWGKTLVLFLGTGICLVTILSAVYSMYTPIRSSDASQILPVQMPTPDTLVHTLRHFAVQLLHMF